jgi:hypothetical protein
LKNLADTYPAGELNSALIQVHGGSVITIELAHMTPVLEGKTLVYDSKVLTMTYNTPDGYAFSVTKKPNLGYLMWQMYLMSYNEEGRPTAVNFELQ